MLGTDPVLFTKENLESCAMPGNLCAKCVTLGLLECVATIAHTNARPGCMREVPWR
jgi:hypothetical protein